MSGAFASASNDLLDLATSNLGENNILRSDGFALFNGAVTGGVGSVLGGGNFWMGAGQGLMVTAFNFLAHKPATSIEISDGDDPIQKGYKGKKELAPATPIENADGTYNTDAYNCHSYAWENGNGDPSDPANADFIRAGITKWDNDPTNNYSKAKALPFDAPNKVGDKLVYFAWDENLKAVVPTHSAVVTKVINGRTIEVTSKWGQAPLYQHHPRDVPSIYGNMNPTFKAPNGKVYSSRIYYR